jgi:hypothetical protein
VNDLVRDMAGSISAEHGIGIDKIDELAHYRSTVELDTMRSLKRALDPKNIMNPGRSCGYNLHLPRHTGEAGRGKAPVEMPANFRSETLENLRWGFPPSPTLPRMTGEENEMTGFSSNCETSSASAG